MRTGIGSFPAPGCVLIDRAACRPILDKCQAQSRPSCRTSGKWNASGQPAEPDRPAPDRRGDGHTVAEDRRPGRSRCDARGRSRAGTDHAGWPRDLAPSLRPPWEPGETSRGRILLGSQSGKPAALVREAIPVAGVVHVRQPRHDRPQSAFALGGPTARDSLAGGCIGNLALRGTHPTAWGNRAAGSIPVTRPWVEPFQPSASRRDCGSSSKRRPTPPGVPTLPA